MKNFVNNLSCPSGPAFGYHVESGKCTAFTAKPEKVGDLSAKSSTLMSSVMGNGDANQGISLEYQVAGSQCHHNSSKWKTMTVDIICDKRTAAKDKLLFVK